MMRSMMLAAMAVAMMNAGLVSAVRRTDSPIPMGPVAIPTWEQQQMVDVINLARSTVNPPAADMKMVQWDDSLAALAQTFTNQCGCIWKEYKDAFLTWCDEMPTPLDVVRFRTIHMAPYYNFTDGQCINTPASVKYCRHPDNYEAAIYSFTERIGCAMTECWPTMGNKSLFHACIVAPGPRPNKPGHPYTAGKPCSQCDTANGWKYCVNNLCSQTPPSPTMSPSPGPTEKPTHQPTHKPTPHPTVKPTHAPTPYPTHKPTHTPTLRQG